MWVQKAGQRRLRGRAGVWELITDTREETQGPNKKAPEPDPGEEAGIRQGRPCREQQQQAQRGIRWWDTGPVSPLSPDSGITTRILAGCTTGAMAVTCAQPTDVVKVRFQASVHLGPGSNQKYSGTMDAYRTIAREEGIRGLWKGKSGLQYHGAFAEISLP